MPCWSPESLSAIRASWPRVRRLSSSGIPRASASRPTEETVRSTEPGVRLPPIQSPGAGTSRFGRCPVAEGAGRSRTARVRRDLKLQDAGDPGVSAPEVFRRQCSPGRRHDGAGCGLQTPRAPATRPRPGMPACGSSNACIAPFNRSEVSRRCGLQFHETGLCVGRPAKILGRGRVVDRVVQGTREDPSGPQGGNCHAPRVSRPIRK